jgi:DNA mismatch repair ATPase MutS
LRKLLSELEREEARPLLYFIDEIFRGTNNRERLIGGRAYIRTVADKNGLGLIATHDLELAKLAEEIPAVQNYHFREEVANGRMIFDYTLRPGPSPTTNALKIMALEGLPVGDP